MSACVSTSYLGMPCSHARLTQNGSMPLALPPRQHAFPYRQVEAQVQPSSTFIHLSKLNLNPAGPADPLYAAWAAQHGRAPAAPAVEARRRAAFHENRRYIEDWNARGASHNLTLNRFADWTQVRTSFPDTFNIGGVEEPACRLACLT